jgi:hypothetical protein
MKPGEDRPRGLPLSSAAGTLVRPPAIAVIITPVMPARSHPLGRVTLVAALCCSFACAASLARADATLPAPDTREYEAGDPYNWRRPLAWTTLVFAGLVAGGGYGFQRAHDRHVADRERACPADPAMMAPPSAACMRLDTQVERAGRLALGGFVSGGVLTLLSVYLFATDMGEDSSVGFAPVAGQWGVAWGGRF